MSSRRRLSETVLENSAALGNPRQQACSKGTSKYKGVCWNKKNQRWQTAINTHSRCLYLGSFDDEAAAARVYDVAALMIRGPQAVLNFPNGNYQDCEGNLVIDKQLSETIQKHLHVAASCRLAAYTAKAVAGCPSDDVGAAVSAAVAALTKNTAGSATVQEETAAAAAAAAVQAVTNATGLKRQRSTVLSFGAARGAPKMMRCHGPVFRQTWPRSTGQQCPLRQQQPLCGLNRQQQLPNQQRQQQQPSGLTNFAGSATATAANKYRMYTPLMSPCHSVQLPPAMSISAQQQQQQQQQHHDVAVRLLSEAVAAAVAAESLHTGGKTDGVQQSVLQEKQQQQQQQHVANDSSSTCSPVTFASRPSISPHIHTTKKDSVTDINMRWLMRQLPQNSLLERIMTGLGGMYGVLCSLHLPQQQQQQEQAASAAAAVPVQWVAQVWDGVRWHKIGSYATEQEAADACYYVLDLAADCFEGMGSDEESQ